MHKVIITNPASVILYLKNEVGDFLESAGSGLYRVGLNKNDTVVYLYRKEFEYLNEHLMKIWMEP